jgi:hypothetical protein
LGLRQKYHDEKVEIKTIQEWIDAGCNLEVHTALLQFGINGSGKQNTCISCKTPVVVLTRTIDAREGLFV